MKRSRRPRERWIPIRAGRKRSSDQLELWAPAPLPRPDSLGTGTGGTAMVGFDGDEREKKSR
jgi:hypothetical protein